MKGFYKKQEITAPKRKKQNPKKISGCESCKKYHECTNGKFPIVGTGENGIMIVMDAVSTQEEDTGEPLSGITEKYVSAKLAEVGIDIRECYVVKAVRCYVPGADPSKFTTAMKNGCKELLRQDIKRLAPKKIIAFGGTSIELLYTDRLSQSRISSGNWNRFYDLAIPDQTYGCWVFANYSPREVLNTLAERMKKLKEYGKFKKEDGPFWEWESLKSDSNFRLYNLYFRKYLKNAIRHKKPFTKIDYMAHCNSIQTPEEATAIIKSLNRPGVLAMDFESDRIGCYHNDSDLITISLSTKDVSYGFNYFKNNKEFVKALQDLLSNPEIKFIVHNLHMELSWARKIIGVDIANCYVDTLLLSHFLRPVINSANSLKFNVLELCGLVYDMEVEPYIKAPDRYEFVRGKKKKVKASIYDKNRMREFPEVKRNMYCAADSWFTMQLFIQKYPRILQNAKQANLFRLYMKGLKTFVKAGEVGFAVNETKLIQNLEICDMKLTTLGSKIQKSPDLSVWYETYDKEFNPDSGDHLRDFFFNLLDYDTPKRTKGNLKSTDAEVLEEIGASLDVAKLIAEYAKYAKIETFLKGIRRNTVNGRLHAKVSLTVASTGRSNSSDPNMQNLSTHDEVAAEMIKGVLEPGEGKKLLAYDYSQLEMRGGYSVHQDPSVRQEILDKNLDVHSLMAQHIFFDLDRASMRVAQIKYGRDHISEKELAGVRKELRAFGKMINFSAMFGAGIQRMYQSLYLEGFKPEHRQYFKEEGITNGSEFRDHTKTIHEAYWERYSVLRDWRNDFWEEYIRTGEAWSPEGWCINTMASKNLVCNFPIQGGSFALCLKALVKLDEEIEKRGLDTKIILMIHDSIEFITTYEDYFENGLKDIIYECLVDYPNNTTDWLKIDLDIDGEFYGDNWAEEVEEEDWEKEYEKVS